MKELSIEEKAKAYDEVLKVLHKYDGANIMFSQSLKEEMFPELKESEDERIREEMIDYFKSLLVQSDKEEFKDLINNKFKRYIAWLEKQGKEETDEWKEGNIIRRGGILALVIKGRRVMKSNGEIFTVQYPDEWVKAVPNEIEHFLNELEKQGKQKHAEWHREDEQNLNACLGYIRDEFLRRWLTDIIHVKYDKPADKVKPKFKVGDTIQPKDPVLGEPRIIERIYPTWGYDTNKGILDFEFEDNWELVEQKPAWSEEDERIYKVVLELMDSYSKGTIGGCIISPNIDRYIKWFKYLKDRVQSKQKKL